MRDTAVPQELKRYKKQDYRKQGGRVEVNAEAGRKSKEQGAEYRKQIGRVECIQEAER